MVSRNVILAAHVIKFGLPFGMLVAGSNLISAALLGETGVTIEVIGQSVMIIGMGVLGGLVLGLSRSK